MDRRGRIHFLTLCDSNETVIFVSKFCMETIQQSMNWWSKERKDKIFILYLKKTKLKRKLTFHIPKLKLQNKLIKNIC